MTLDAGDDVTMIFDVGSHGIQPARDLYKSQCDLFDTQAHSLCRHDLPISV